MNARGLIRCGLAAGIAWLVATGATAQRAPGGPGDPVARAKPGDVRLMVTGAIELPIEAVRKQMERAVGHPLVIQYGSARGNLRAEILAGQAFEVALLLPDVTAQLLAAGKIAPERADIARVSIAIGQRGGVRLVDVSTPSALKTAMLNAKSLRWLPTGVALPTVNRILDTLDIREAVNATHNARGLVPLAADEYEIQIYPLSEILGDAYLGVRNLGPVMDSLQVPQVISAVVGTNTGDRRSADAVIAFLKGPAMESALEANGMTR